VSETAPLRRRLPAAGRRRRSRTPTAAERGGPGRAQRGDSSIQRGRPDPARRHFGSATTRTRTRHANPDPSARPAPRGLGSRPSATARRRCQRGAPYRTNDVDADQRRRTIPAPETAPLTSARNRREPDPVVCYAPTGGAMTQPSAVVVRCGGGARSALIHRADSRSVISTSRPTSADDGHTWAAKRGVTCGNAGTAPRGRVTTRPCRRRRRCGPGQPVVGTVKS
jgi:hypothetical protein